MSRGAKVRIRPTRFSKFAGESIWWVASVALFAGIWEFCWYMGWANPMLLPPPHIFLQDILLAGKLFDKSIEGIEVKNKPIFSVQYHPEASPGPQDSRYLFKKFINLISKEKNYAKKKRS